MVKLCTNSMVTPIHHDTQRGGQDTESAKAKEERDEEGGERELGPGKDAEFRESQETMRWQEIKKL